MDGTAMHGAVSPHSLMPLVPMRWTPVVVVWNLLLKYTTPFAVEMRVELFGGTRTVARVRTTRPRDFAKVIVTDMILLCDVDMFAQKSLILVLSPVTVAVVL